ncbi:MAG: secretion protein HlyD, partial [Hyphomicrobiales bacterium]|nr:secretion protein HlyD [Hyphomicrobiales bacterium]
EWAVFRVAEGRAHLARVEIGQRNTENAQLLSGLKVGDVVVLHPSDRVADGVRIEERGNSSKATR